MYGARKSALNRLYDENVRLKIYRGVAMNNGKADSQLVQISFA